jgi:hypothetical protein
LQNAVRIEIFGQIDAKDIIVGNNARLYFASSAGSVQKKYENVVCDGPIAIKTDAGCRKAADENRARDGNSGFGYASNWHQHPPGCFHFRGNNGNDNKYMFNQNLQSTASGKGDNNYKDKSVCPKYDIGVFTFKSLLAEDGGIIRFQRGAMVNVTDSVTVGGQYRTKESQISAGGKFELLARNILVRETGTLGAFESENKQKCKIEIGSDGITKLGDNGGNGFDLIIGSQEQPVDTVQLEGGLINVAPCHSSESGTGSLQLFANSFEGDGKVNAKGTKCKPNVIDINAFQFSQDSILLQYSGTDSQCSFLNVEVVKKTVNKTLESKVGYDCSCKKTTVVKKNLTVLVESTVVFGELLTGMETGMASCTEKQGRSLSAVEEIGTCVVCSKIAPSRDEDVRTDGEKLIKGKKCMTSYIVKNLVEKSYEECRGEAKGLFRQWSKTGTRDVTTTEQQSVSSTVVQTAVTPVASTSTAEECKPVNIEMDDIIKDAIEYYEVDVVPKYFKTSLNIRNPPAASSIDVLNSMLTINTCHDTKLSIISKLEAFLQNRFCDAIYVEKGTCQICKSFSDETDDKKKEFAKVVTTSGKIITGVKCDNDDDGWTYSDVSQAQCSSLLTSGYMQWDKTHESTNLAKCLTLKATPVGKEHLLDMENV